MIPGTPAEIRALLTDRGIHPRKRFGQHFLADVNLRDAVVREAGVLPGDLVIEVGPGLGVLTQGLLAAGADVLAAEVDPKLCDFLAEEFPDAGRFTLFRGDALGETGLRGDLLAAARERRAGRRLLLVSNLPYAAASPVFAALARLADPPESATAMVQREMALRMAARVGDDDYGPLAVLLALRGEARILREVGGRVFFPAAPVQSALVSFRPRETDLSAVLAADRVSRAAFLHRRKSLANALKTGGCDAAMVADALSALGIDPGLRPEALPPDRWLALGAALPAPAREEARR